MTKALARIVLVIAVVVVPFVIVKIWDEWRNIVKVLDEWRNR